MELQDRVTVVLTQYGANVLNQKNKEFNDMCPKIKPLKTNYKEGDLFTSNLYDIINSFKEEFGVGCHVCFKNIVPAEHPKDIFKSGTCKERIEMKQPNESSRIALDKMIIRKFLEGFDCRIFNDVMVMGPVTIRSTGKASRKEKDEFVSMTVYEILVNAYNDIFDECIKLKSKLARIQEVIKDE